ncbi:hypothetical protein Tcan_14253 [Toxocara canis]|uniref:Uncharacterized protein n=1 Tax=Toxocara canis TaxID=6265 RepID=A0A0B2VHD8_TOXCA|nr:hypothetical protein Tcan_14253 [Toxocara canis]
MAIFIVHATPIMRKFRLPQRWKVINIANFSDSLDYLKPCLFVQAMTDDDQTSLSSPYELSCKLSDEEKTIQEIWTEIDISNSWEMLLIQSPSSIMALGELMVLSLTPSKRTSVSVTEGVSLREHKYNVDSGYLQTLLVQAVNEGRIAQEAAHQSMSIIRHDMNEIPRAIKSILELLSQHSSDHVRFQLPIQIKRIRGIVDDSAREADSLESRFQKAMQLMSDRSSSIGRAGFSLLAEVRIFWSAVISFCKELSKLVQYTLDSSCNAFIATLHAQFDVASKQNKFAIKQKARDEIYHTSIAMIAYALSARHLANAYIRYSGRFIMPQINTIARYPMLATNEIEFAKAQRQFKEYNVACERETNRIITMNGTTNKRRSILELDMGLNLHISDIGADLDVFLPAVADFRRGKLNRSTSRKKEQKVRQKEEKELENEGMKLKEDEKKRMREEMYRAKEEKKRAKEEENRTREEKKKEKEREQKRLKEEKHRLKEEDKHHKWDEMEQENSKHNNSLRTKFWRRSSSTHSRSPLSPQSLQFPLSVQPQSVQQYYPSPQPQPFLTPHSSLQSKNSAHSPQSPSPLSPQSIQPVVPTGTQIYHEYPSQSVVHSIQSPHRPQSVHSPLTPQSPQSPIPLESEQSTQFPMSPIHSQPLPSNHCTTTQIVQMPAQYFQYPSTNFQNSNQTVAQSQLSEIPQRAEDVQHSQPQHSVLSGQNIPQMSHTQLVSVENIPQMSHTQLVSVETPKIPIQVADAQTTQYSPPSSQYVSRDGRGYVQFPSPIQSSTPLQFAHRYRQNAQQSSRQRRPISYPSNFRRAEFNHSGQYFEYPFYRSHEAEEAMRSAQYPHFSRSPRHPVSPQSPLSLPSSESSYGYHSLQYTQTPPGANSPPPLILPQNREGEKREGILDRLRASFSRKSRKTKANNDHEMHTTRPPIS